MYDKIVFLMPGRGLRPAGGFKIVFKYAEFFARQSVSVHIVYPYVDYNFFNKNYSLAFKLKLCFGYFFRFFMKKIELQKWHVFSLNVKQHIVFKLGRNCRLYGDKNTAFFATAVDTAYALNEIKSISDKDKYYLIQGFENWDFDDDYVYNSYKFPFHKIVIANWLEKQVNKVGENATLIQNGLDFSYFHLTTPIEKRSAYEISMLYHTSDVKRCVDAFAALDIVKKQIPELHVNIFGSFDKPSLPDWYTYYKTPSKEVHNKIYNTAAIFVASSSTEGWGLTPCEAMQCGAAVVCTDAGGYLEFAKHEKTALVSEVYDVPALARNILILITDNALRMKLAYAGNNYIKQFTWDKSFAKMSELLAEKSK